MSPSHRCRRSLDVFAASPFLAAGITAALGSLLVAAGCTLNKEQFRAEKVIARIGGSQGQILEPKRCLLKVAIITRPIRDQAINDSVWSVADMHCVPEDARQALETNGVRIGKIIGALPADLESALNAKPPHQVEPVTFLPETNEPTLIRTAEGVPQVSLLTNLDNRVVAKDYEMASGFLRALTDHDGERGVSLRIIPEIHHGPVTRGYQNIPNPGAYQPNQLTISDSQQQDALVALASTTVLQPGEVAVMTCDVERDHTLGSFLFTLTEPNSDRRMQNLILIWASRNKSGTIEADNLHQSTDRPKESRLARFEFKSNRKSDDRAGAPPKDEATVKAKDEDEDEPPAQ